MNFTSAAPVEPDPSPLTECELAAARRQFRDSGMVVLPAVFEPEFIRRLDTAYQELLAARPVDRVQATSGEQHVQMQMPLRPPFSDADLVANAYVCQILTAELGDGFACSYYNSNTAYPGSTRQPVHRDSDHVFGQQLPVATPPTGIVLNIPLCDFSVHNGSTEVWPATHLLVDRPGDEQVSLTERTEVLGSRRLDVPAGSAVLRDPRVWHRGMPNLSDRPRSMIAIVYKRRWLGFRHPALRVPESTWSSWPDRVRSIFASIPRDEG